MVAVTLLQVRCRGGGAFGCPGIAAGKSQMEGEVQGTEVSEYCMQQWVLVRCCCRCNAGAATRGWLARVCAVIGNCYTEGAGC